MLCWKVIAEREWTEKPLKHARARSIIARLHGRQIWFAESLNIIGTSWSWPTPMPLM